MLVSPDKQALLTDFGISRMDSLSTGYTSHSVRGTARWQAVEFFRLGEGPPPEHTKNTDLWAFGMTVYVSDAKYSGRNAANLLNYPGAPNKGPTFRLLEGRSPRHPLYLSRQAAKAAYILRSSRGSIDGAVYVVALQQLLEF